MNGSGVWVGPANAPMSYELIAVLGTGDKGAVWRARQPATSEPDGAERDVAIRISPHDADDSRWEDYATRIAALVHPGLVRVRDVFTSVGSHGADRSTSAVTFRHVVMDYEPGLSLRQWLDEHPEARLSERLTLLRPIAAAVDALHAAGCGVAHGDIRPDNIIIRADRSAVLVNIGRFKISGGGANPYAAPEQRHPGVEPSSESDVYSFAVTVLATVTGQAPPITPNGYLDNTRLRQHLRSTPSTRRRPFLVRHLTTAMHKPAEHRPRTLRPWLDAPRRRCRIVITAGVILTLLGTTGWVARPTPSATVALTSPTPPLSSVPAELPFATLVDPPPDATVLTTAEAGVAAPSTDPVSPVAPDEDAAKAPDDPRFTLLSWPLAAGCDSRSVAARTGGPSWDRLVSRHDIRREVIALGGGTWQEGLLHFLFAPTGTSPVRITSIILSPVPEAPPAWVFQPTAPPGPAEPSVCGTSLGRYQFGFDYDLDAGTGGPKFSELPVVPVGSSADITLYVRACRANYRWQLTVEYLVDGSASIRSYTDPSTFVSYGYGERTPIYAGYQDGTGGIRLLADSTLTGDSCSLSPLLVSTASDAGPSPSTAPSSAPKPTEPAPDAAVTASPATSPTGTATSTSTSRPSAQPTP